MSESNIYYPSFPLKKSFESLFIPIVIEDNQMKINLDRYHQYILLLIARKAVEICADHTPLELIERRNKSFNLSYKRFFIDLDFISGKINGSAKLTRYIFESPSKLDIKDYARYIDEFTCDRLAQSPLKSKEKQKLQLEFTQFCDDMMTAYIRTEHKMEWRIDAIRKIAPLPVTYE
jgi:hypothetical protein